MIAPKKILLVQTSFLGDTILATPVISGIKKLYPDAGLWMLATPAGAELVRHDPLLSGVLTFDKRGKEAGLRGLFSKAAGLAAMKFDRVYSLHRSYRTALLLRLARIPVRIGFSNARLAFLYHQLKKRDASQHEVQRSLAILSGEMDLGAADQSLRIFSDSEGRLPAAVRGLTEGGSSYAVLASGSHWETKRWYTGGFERTARELLARGLKVVLLGRAEEGELGAVLSGTGGVIDLTGKTSLSETAAIIQRASLLVCNDSMVLHLGSAFKVPTVVVFCSTSPDFGFGPWLNRARIVEKSGLSCKPCGRHGFHACPLGTEICMREVPAEQVIAACEELLGGEV